MLFDEKISAVTVLFENLDAAINRFQSDSGLHCKPGCGKCCFKADIEATVLEFLPFAASLYHAGKSEEWHEQLRLSTSPVCRILNPTSTGVGLCSEYSHRGLICRLFGYSARTNKYGQKELVTCAIIKEEQAADFVKAEQQIGRGGSVPVMSDFYMQLHAIDADLSRDFYPINTAIQKALEVVMHHFSYAR
ncbi:MAG: YkgJ family cysteine cluster protein [Cytophagales bacterium]|nr:YkgJ family cysteine cluster protein [Cytophagales bacterium]